MFNQHQGRLRGTIGLALSTTLGLALILATGPLNTLASTLAPSDQGQALNPVTIAAGATANLTVRGFCLDFGKPFPTDNTTTKGLADDKVRAALNYSIQKGYTEGNPAQVELAVWFLRDNTWHNADHTVAQEIVDNATTANTPSTSGDGLSLSDAVSQNKVTLQATFVAQTAEHFYGDTTLQISNTGTADVKIYMPVGTVFTVPNGGGNFQDLAAYALGVPGTQQAAVPTSTAEPTKTAAPTSTTEPTMTVAASATVAAARPTATQTVRPAATATATRPAPSGLPQTGSPDGTGSNEGLVLTLLALTLVALGFVIRFEQLKRASTSRRG
jgi:hypothetical protein